MTSYAERYSLTTIKGLSEHMLANATEYLLIVPDPDPDKEGEFVLLFKADDPQRWADAIDELASNFLADNGL